MVGGKSRERGPARKICFVDGETLQDIVRLQVRHFSQHLPFGCRCQSRGRTLSGCSRRRPGVWPPFDSTRGQWNQRSGVGSSRNPHLPTPVASKDQRFGKVLFACCDPPGHAKRALIGEETAGVKTISNLTSHLPHPLGASWSFFFLPERRAQKHSAFGHQRITAREAFLPLASSDPASSPHSRLMAQ